jgi:hypothetical protein
MLRGNHGPRYTFILNIEVKLSLRPKVFAYARGDHRLVREAR